MAGFGFSATDQIYRGVHRGADVGWQGGLEPFGPLELSPAAACLSYGLGIFEGLKAQRGVDGRLRLFRPDENARRFVRSAGKILLEPFPPADFVAAVENVVRANLRFVPAAGEGALYLRPIELASEARLGAAPCAEHTVVIYAAPVGSYFAAGADPTGLRLRILEQARVVAGGSGDAKAMGNYGGCLATVRGWRQQGYHDVLFTHASDARLVTEASGANVFARLGDDLLVTPPLDDQILPGITRDSVIALARAEGLTVQERPLAVEELLSAQEVFCTGTAWTVQSVARLEHGDRGVDLPGGAVAARLRAQLFELQRGAAEDRWGWMHELAI